MKNTKVLVADSSETCNKVVGHYLQHMGIEEKNVTIVNNGNKALELAKKELFDVVILSPHKLGMSATEIAVQIKSQYKENAPKIIEYTSGALGHKPNEVFDNVIFKPTTEKIFAEKLLEVLNMVEAV